MNRSPRWGLARVSGPSMEPTLRDGDRVLLDYRGKPRPGAVAVVRLPNGGEVSIKRLTLLDDEGWWVTRDSWTRGVESWQEARGAVPVSDVFAIARWRVWPRPGRIRRA